MPDQTKLAELYASYHQARGLRLSEAEFACMLPMYPAVVVAAADGNFDQNEKLFLKSVGKGLAATFKFELEPKEVGELADAYFEELEFLAQNLWEWKPLFFDAIKELVVLDKDKSLQLENMMNAIAKVSGAINKSEEYSIENIRKELNLN